MGNNRQIVIAANWKMHKNVEETADFIREVKVMVEKDDLEIVIFPPTIAVAMAQMIAPYYDIKIGAQNIYWEDQGAYTGEISASMVADAGCSYCLTGHSERRQYFGETDEMVCRKNMAAISRGLRVIMCVGESEGERQDGQTLEILENQLRGGLQGIEPNRELIIAYEPLWAIGTGKTATPEDAEEACAYIRQVIDLLWPGLAKEISILYGGSVKPDNMARLMACPNIDGALVGGASLDPQSFADIVNY
ncbi:MAG: triose-phosphate isomerase [Clostridiales bacterium]|nr:triose-phosphate isomerase [Clostridiales bacterium]